MTSTLRILDANANRAREALRVMEDAARFLLEDAALSGELKALRHRLATVMAGVAGLDEYRDTPGDVGTTLTTPTEGEREDAVAVALAAGKRLSEALRSIEEYGKTLADSYPDLPRAVEAMRYQGYELERRLNVAMRQPARPSVQWRVCLLLTEALCRQPWDRVLHEALDAGVDCVQVREKTMEGGALLERATRIVGACHTNGRACIVNDRPDVALLAGADGVHLGQGDLPAAAVRRCAPAGFLIGVSTSNLEEAKAAAAAGADYCGVGPMFATTTKHKPILAGPEYLRDYLAWDAERAAAPLPHLAIGGITSGNIALLSDVGVRGIAVSASVCAAEHPGRVVSELLRQLDDQPPG